MRSDNPHRTLLLAASIIVTAVLHGCAPHPPPVREPWLLPHAGDPVTETLSRLTLEEKIAQMIMPNAYNYYYSSESDQFVRLRRLVKDRKVGGLVFFQGDVYETAVLANRLQELSEVPLLIGSDFEWGAAMRVRRTTRFPEAMALGAAGDTLLASRMGKAVAAEARAIGVQQVYAPVADVNSDPDNPVINTRSFGEDPQRVADLAGAFASGLSSGGVLATAKHFPGHGGTQADSHIDLPVVGGTRERLDSVELLPFRALIRRGIGSVMVAHLAVPALEPRRSLPATLSAAIVSGLLEHDLGFSGLTVTDAMTMGAVVRTYGTDSAAVRAVEAGDDMLLMVEDEDRVVDAVAGAVRTGRISEERIDRSVKKILEVKRSLGLFEQRTVDLTGIPEAVATPEHLSLAKEIARASTTVLKNDGVLPIEQFGPRRVLALTVSDAENYRTEIQRPTSPWPNEPVGDYFTMQVRRRYNGVQTAVIDPSCDSLDAAAVLRKASASDLILCAVFSRARSGSGKMGLPREVSGVLAPVMGLGKPVVVIAMGSPYVLTSFPGAAAYMCSYSDCEASTEAAVEVLFGEAASSGRLPVTIPGMFSRGTGIGIGQSALRQDAPESAGFDRGRLSAVDSVVTAAIRDSAFPGAQVVVGKDGVIVYSKAFGTFRYGQPAEKVNRSTMYDLASVTKVIATTPAIMRLYDEGRIALDDPVARYIPQFANRGKGAVTIRNLLVHDGGLPAFKRLFLTCRSPEEVLDSVYNTEMIYTPGDSTVYSDFDFITLGKIVERASGVALDAYADSVFFRPLGMRRTMYNPPRRLWENVAPSEYDSLFRRQLVRGVVHDENAYALGGVSGHAGLFSTASDLAVYLQMLMNGGNYGGRGYLRPETVRRFIARQAPKSSRALGWDTKSTSGYSSAGSLMGERTYGHTGFTGTSVWADPERKIFVILLTNRVYPTRDNQKISKIRPALHDAVIRALNQ